MPTEQVEPSLTPLVCPGCGGTNVQALLRGTGYGTYSIRGLRDGKLVLASKPTEEWCDDNPDELDEELKCLDCDAYPDINDHHLRQEDFVIEPKAATDDR